MFLTIFLFLITPPTRLLVLCHPFGTFFVRVCVMLLRYSSMFIDMAFVGDRNMAAASIGRIIIGAFWIIRMPSMVFDVIL